MTKYAVVIVSALMLGGIGTWVAVPQTARAEADAYPRIAAAIRELEEAIRYMEAAPHDFGGHKAAAIRDSRAAIGQLRRLVETEGHPRISAAIRELDEAIRYLEEVPEDFGGRKAAAIRDARAAIRQLRLVEEYREGPRR